MTFYDDAEQARNSVHPGDVVVAKEEPWRAVEWSGIHLRGYSLLDGRLEDVAWNSIEEYHYRDDVDATALAEEYADQDDAGDEPEEGGEA